MRSEILVREGALELPGTLGLPDSPVGMVVFAHGSGSSRLSPRNRQVADSLNEAGLATLLFDLLTEEESLDRGNVFDIPLLASRLVIATRWLERLKGVAGLPLGFFGASTGAAAALIAAAELGPAVSAVVSRGGRPDLAIPRLREVTAPTLLLVGGNDEVVIELNQRALRFLREGRLAIVPGATHLFEEPGALELVASEARAWFLSRFRQVAKPGAA